MKRNKMIFVYGLIMLVIVALFVVLGYVTSPRHDENETKSQTLIDEKQNSIRKLEEELATVKKENATYKEHVEDMTKDYKLLADQKMELELELGRKKNAIAALEASLPENDVVMAQALADLKDIYDTYKSGNVQDAKTAFEKIEPMGYNDATLAYYEILKDVMSEN